MLVRTVGASAFPAVDVQLPPRRREAVPEAGGGGRAPDGELRPLESRRVKGEELAEVFRAFCHRRKWGGGRRGELVDRDQDRGLRG
jgi:hypothetical protein